MAGDLKREQFTVSVSPHVRDEETVSRIMWWVNLSLSPALLMSFYYFGQSVFVLRPSSQPSPRLWRARQDERGVV